MFSGSWDLPVFDIARYIYNPVEKALKGTIGFEIEDMEVQ